MSRLIRDSDDLTPQSYTLYGIVIRREPKSNFQTIIPFSIENTFEKKEDLKLADNDLVYVFNQSQITTLAAAASAALGTTSSASQNPIATFRAANSSGSSSSSTSSQSSTSPTNGTQPAGAASTSNAGTTGKSIFRK